MVKLDGASHSYFLGLYKVIILSNYIQYLTPSWFLARLQNKLYTTNRKHEI